MENNSYYYEHEQGFIRCINHDQQDIFPGQSLLALHHHNLTNPVTLRDSKRLMRIIFNRLLGDRPLKSRELF